MPENFFYARCNIETCGKIFKGQLSWTGIPGAAHIYDHEDKSPLIDLLQHHHEETNMLSQHNSFALFTEIKLALLPPDEEADWAIIYRKFPSAIGFIGVTRQRNVAFSLKKDPTES